LSLDDTTRDSDQIIEISNDYNSNINNNNNNNKVNNKYLI